MLHWAYLQSSTTSIRRRQSPVRRRPFSVPGFVETMPERERVNSGVFERQPTRAPNLAIAPASRMPGTAGNEQLRFGGPSGWAPPDG